MSWGNMSSDMSAVSPQSAISRVSSSTFTLSYKFFIKITRDLLNLKTKYLSSCKKQTKMHLEVLPTDRQKLRCPLSASLVLLILL